MWWSLYDIRARSIARTGRRQAFWAQVPFDRNKLATSIHIALRKRNIDSDRVERMISGIVRQLESMGDVEVHSEQIGALVMEALKGLDPVAYVRFASVYRDFREASDFAEVLGEIARVPGDATTPTGSAPRHARDDDHDWSSVAPITPKKH